MFGEIAIGLFVMLGWGIADFLQSIPIRKVGTKNTILFTNIVMGLLTLPFLLFPGALDITFANLVILLIAGIAEVIAIKNFYEGMRIGELAIVMPISASYSMVTVALSYLILGKVLSIMSIVSIAVLITGIVLSSADFRKMRSLHAQKGVKEAVAAFLGWGVIFFLYDVVSEEAFIFGIRSAQTGFLPLFIWSSILIGLSLIAYSLLTGAKLAKEQILKKDTGLVMIFTNVIYTIVWLALTFGISMFGSTIIVPVSSVFPAVGVLLALIFYKEKLVPNQIIGIITILAGLFLISIA